jgi:hypothetical protein
VKCGAQSFFHYRVVKRHLLVDTLGLLLAVVSTSTHIDDGAAAVDLLTQISAQDFPRLETMFGDAKKTPNANRNPPPRWSNLAIFT